MDNYLCGIMMIRTTDYWTKNTDIMFDKAYKQINMNNERNLASTYLLAYDAYSDDKFIKLMKNNIKTKDELGICLEIIKPMAEKAGIKWRGKLGFEWEHTPSTYLTLGYTNAEKEKLIDEAMNTFKKSFGYYPKTIGAWVIDTYSIKYLTDKYGIDAVLFCREQWGMDDMSLWGGPYYGGYYPCKNNMLCPASTEKEQINTPIFRYYVNDPIYCYYEHRDEEFNGIPSGPQTQEPYTQTGKNPDWNKWIWDCIYGEKSSGFSYFQFGQENSFDWARVNHGRTIQHNAWDEYAKDKYTVEDISVGEMGRRFKEKYKKTPARMVSALNDWNNSGRQSVWFNNDNYRINIFTENGEVRIRDIHIFDESYRERYLSVPCEEKTVLYDNLPVMDGIRFAINDSEKPGIYLGNGYIKNSYETDGIFVTEIQSEKSTVTIKLTDKKIEILSEKDFELEFRYNCSPYGSRSNILSFGEKEIEYVLRRKFYSIIFEDGKMDNLMIKSENGKITVNLKGKQSYDA